MNYRHAYHAGNFADVLKHVVLALVIEYLKRKEAPFRVIDTHAGAGRYALDLGRGRQDRRMAGRHRAASSGPTRSRCRRDVARHLRALPGRRAPGECAAAASAVYPGSPAIALGADAPQDTLIANELHPEEPCCAQGRHRRRSQGQGDGARRLGRAQVAAAAQGAARRRADRSPVRGDATSSTAWPTGLAQGLQRFATGIYLAWYPIKDPKPIARFHARLAALGVAPSSCASSS